MKYLGVIPARGGSKGIPRKNIKKLMGKPLIEYTIDAALNSNLDDVVVTSDCEEILEFSRIKGVRTITRPSELSRDDTPSRPVIEHAYNAAEQHFDAVVTLQPTSPLRTFQHINEALKMFTNSAYADSLVSVEKVPHNMTPESLMVLENGQLVDYLVGQEKVLRRQDKKTYYARNGAAIYITRSDNLKEFIFGGNIVSYKMARLSSFDLDDLEDWQLIEMVLSEKHGCND